MTDTSIHTTPEAPAERKGRVRRFIGALGRFVFAAGVGLWHATLYFFKVITSFALAYIDAVNVYTSRPTEGQTRAWIAYPWVRYPLRAILWLFAPAVVFIAPIGIAVLVAMLCVAFDQLTWDIYEVDDKFTTIVSEKEGQPPTVNDIGITLMSASYHQMERELDKGWVVNDWSGLQTFDNRVNRQLGVRHASIELLTALSGAITKLGSTDEENPLIVQARQSGFAFDPDSWMFPASENQYWEGIALIKEYQDQLRSHAAEATINITNTDIEEILRILDTRVLEVPHGRLNARNFEASWFKLDDDVYFAVGAAIVARDTMVAMRHAFKDKIEIAGATINMDRAIQSLEAIVRFHPVVITRGDGDSMWADHRAKLSRYYTDARQRIHDVADAIQR